MPEKYNFTPERNTPFSQKILDLAQAIATKFSTFPSVIAVALAGSQTSRVADNLSDLDFFIYTQLEIP